jgi:transposase
VTVEPTQEAAMIRIQLPQAEVDRLEGLFRSTRDRKLRDRLQIVLMAHKGRAHKNIASDLGIHRIGVTRWLNAYCARGLQGLLPKKAKGKTANIPASMADEIRRRVIQGPASQNLDRANWTHEELADHLRKTHGIKTSRSAVQRFCSKIDIRLYRPTYRFLRGDKAKQEAAKEDLAALKKKRRQASWCY